MELKNKITDYLGKILDYIWFLYYLWPVQYIYNNGNVFLGKDFQEMLESYSIELKAITIKNL